MPLSVEPKTDVTDLAKEELDLLAEEAQVCSYGDTVHYTDPPKLFERCDGSWLVDGKGVEYLDLQMSYSAVNFGYRNPRIERALRRQLGRLPQLGSQYLHREKIELARAIVRRNAVTFGAQGRVHFNVGGSQAIEDALKLARNYSGGKGLTFAFEGGYHGRTLGAAAISSSYRYRRRYGHFSDRAQFVPFPYCFRCPYGKRREDCGLYCVDQFARLFDSEYHGVYDLEADKSEYIAFFAEPIQGRGGYVIPPPGYFEKLKKTLEARQILFVDDEIQMGFHRTGRFWAIENFGVAPDIVVFGKALTNGLNPLSGLWAREALIAPEVFPPGSTHSTFAANPLGTAVGLEVVRMLDEEDYGAITLAKGAYFLAGLQELQRRHPIVADVDGLGLALRAEICASDGFTPDPEMLNRICTIALSGTLEVGSRRYGLVLDVGGYYNNVITFAPALTISTQEMDLAVTLLDQLLSRASVTD
jgi:4-aminobutyrate aminotransferase / (S)-3-amino-2-methylpropionate transaminase / 5-aminovalerate transaminase